MFGFESLDCADVERFSCVHLTGRNIFELWEGQMYLHIRREINPVALKLVCMLGLPGSPFLKFQGRDTQDTHNL